MSSSTRQSRWAGDATHDGRQSRYRSRELDVESLAAGVPRRGRRRANLGCWRTEWLSEAARLQAS